MTAPHTSPVLASGVYEGRVVHARHQPRPHRFTYRVFELLLDLEELDEVFQGAWLWSVERPNLGSFRRRDFLGPTDRPLREAVRERVAQDTGELPPDGPIRLLTQIALFGYCFNPVSFYYLFEADGETWGIISEPAIFTVSWREGAEWARIVHAPGLRGDGQCPEVISHAWVQRSQVVLSGNYTAKCSHFLGSTATSNQNGGISLTHLVG